MTRVVDKIKERPERRFGSGYAEGEVNQMWRCAVLAKWEIK